MSLRESEVDQMWRKLGYDVDPSSDHVRATLVVNDVIILKSRRSHGRGKLDGNIPHKIRGQMKLNERQFDDAVKCPLTRAAYFEILRSKGLLP